MGLMYNQVCYYVPWILQAYTPTYLIMKVFNQLKKCLPFTNHLTVCHTIVILWNSLELVLTNNHFEFNGKYYYQLSGTAMGAKLAPSYANIFMTKFEEKYVYTYPLQPKLWRRFIDDIFI